MIQLDRGFRANYSTRVPDDSGVVPDFLGTGERPGPPRPRLVVEMGDDVWTVKFVADRDFSRRVVSEIVPTSDLAVFCAIVHGSVFVVDVGSPQSAFYVNTGGSVTGVMCAVAEGLVLLATDWHVFALRVSRVEWRSRRVAIEGIRLDRIEEGRVLGAADEDSNGSREFSIDLADGTDAGGFSEIG